MRGLYLAEAAMLAQQARLNVISNNLANVRNAGYKKDEMAQASFGEHLLCCCGRVDPAGRPGPAFRPLGSMAHSVAVGAIQTELSPGSIEETGRELDFALSEGYFTLQGEEGILYTRNGRFFLDSSGLLATAEGLTVLGERGAIPLGGAPFTVDEEGLIHGQDHPPDRLRITFFSPEARLEKIGDNYFRLLSGEVAAENRVPRLYWRCLESSNTDLTREMAALLQVKRSFEAAQKMLSCYDQLLDRSANELGSLS